MTESTAAAVVLVLEDEPLQRLMICDLVANAGFEAVEAMDADDAIAILESRPDIRVVFADLDMPGGHDGLKLAATIRTRWPPIELILTSGRRTPNIDDLPARGIFMPKPYQQERVIKAVRDFVAAA